MDVLLTTYGDPFPSPMLQREATFIGVEHKVWSSSKVVTLKDFSQEAKVVHPHCTAISEGFSHLKGEMWVLGPETIPG